MYGVYKDLVQTLNVDFLQNICTTTVPSWSLSAFLFLSSLTQFTDSTSWYAPLDFHCHTTWKVNERLRKNIKYSYGFSSKSLESYNFCATQCVIKTPVIFFLSVLITTLMWRPSSTSNNFNKLRQFLWLFWKWHFSRNFGGVGSHSALPGFKLF